MSASNSQDSRSSRGSGRRPSRRPSRGGNRSSRRRKVCEFCVDKMDHIDYKRLDVLEKYITERGKIVGRRKSGTCAKHQRRLAIAIKRARYLALLPYTAGHARTSQPVSRPVVSLEENDEQTAPVEAVDEEQDEVQAQAGDMDEQDSVLDEIDDDAQDDNVIEETDDDVQEDNES